VDKCLPSTLKNLRKREGLSQPALAEAVGINERTVSRIETGRSAPHSVTRNMLALYFDVSPEDIVFLADVEAL
jgi:transcriptional regulator with XRE-family HTH domain